MFRFFVIFVFLFLPNMLFSHQSFSLEQLNIDVEFNAIIDRSFNSSGDIISERRSTLDSSGEIILQELYFRSQGRLNLTHTYHYEYSETGDLLRVIGRSSSNRIVSYVMYIYSVGSWTDRDSDYKNNLDQLSNTLTLTRVYFDAKHRKVAIINTVGVSEYPDATSFYFYDDQDQLIEYQHSEYSADYAYYYSYNENSNVVKIDGQDFGEGYESLGEIRTTFPFIFDYTYNQFGIDQIEINNGFVWDFEYESGALTRIAIYNPENQLVREMLF
jgi:hypothetical protein